MRCLSFVFALFVFVLVRSCSFLLAPVRARAPVNPFLRVFGSLFTSRPRARACRFRSGVDRRLHPPGPPLSAVSFYFVLRFASRSGPRPSIAGFTSGFLSFLDLRGLVFSLFVASRGLAMRAPGEFIVPDGSPQAHKKKSSLGCPYPFWLKAYCVYPGLG